MKVIGKTKDGFMVDATVDELAMCAGYKFVVDAERDRVPGFSADYSRGHNITLGTTIAVTKTFNYLESLREHEKECRSSAAFLRGMADMLDAAMPTTIIPPSEVE